MIAFCDHIAFLIRNALMSSNYENIHYDVLDMKSDLDPEYGYLLSTKKTVRVQDHNGTKYRITIEEEE